MNVLYNKFIKALKNPELIILLILNNKYIGTLFSDELFLKLKYRLIMKKKLILKNPQTFNEKLQWLKLHDRKPKYTMMVDKYEVRKYIAQKLGEEYLIPLLGVWDNVDDIDFDALPNQFVLKCNHNSGLGMCICKDKSKLDIEKVKKELKKGLKQDYYMTGREWPYKNVKQKIIAEQYISDGNENGLTDYKFFCFDGNVHSVMLCIDRDTEPKFYFFDREWNLLKLNIRGKDVPDNFTLPKPDRMEDMFKIASQLSKGMKFLRVDLYCCNSKIYFGELTFFPDSGFDANLLTETDKLFGNLINL